MQTKFVLNTSNGGSHLLPYPHNVFHANIVWLLFLTRCVERILFWRVLRNYNILSKTVSVRELRIWSSLVFLFKTVFWGLRRAAQSHVIHSHISSINKPWSFNMFVWQTHWDSTLYSLTIKVLLVKTNLIEIFEQRK